MSDHHDGVENPFILSFSDLMTGLLMVFILLLIVVMIEFRHETIETEEKSYTPDILKLVIAEELEDRLSEISKEIQVDTMTATVTLGESVTFDQGSAFLSREGRDLLREVVPAFCDVVLSDKYDSYIAVVSIEGFTTDDWYPYEPGSRKSYVRNLELSQRRAYSILDYIYGDHSPWNESEWWYLPLRKRVIAGGRSFNELKETGNSRRIEISFQITTDPQVLMSAMDYLRELDVNLEEAREVIRQKYSQELE